MKRRRTLIQLIGSRSGNSLIEFSIALPMLLMILIGIASYASWFFMAHSIQQAANDAARAGVAGLTAAERASLVQGTVTLDVTRTSMLDPAKATVAVQDDGASLFVTVSYDASKSGLLKMPIVPTPPLQIVRTASVRLDTF